MIKEKAKVRSVAMRTWYRQSIVRVVLDFPLEEMDKNIYSILSEYIGKIMYIRVQEEPFDQKKLSEFEVKEND